MSATDPTPAERPCVICRRTESEHRDRNGHGFAPAVPDTGDVEALLVEWRESSASGHPNCAYDADCVACAADEMERRLAAHDAEVRRATAERIAQAIRERRREFSRLRADAQYLAALDDAYGLARNAREDGAR
ncbi:hypothetical protein [Nocardioides sp. LHG3406-4]|uniref:hypothetical protein n=1 Tax=Nocardioides sp. LHG3406-4 TaxID=2804575 RepID=UPI003CECE5D7